MRRKKQKQKLAENAEEHTKDKKANKRFQRYSTNVSGGPTSQEEAATLAGYTFLANCIYSDKKSEWYIKDVMDLAIETYYYAKVEEAKIPGNCGCSKDVKKLKCLSFYGCKNKGNGVICTYECGPLCRNNPFRESNTMESKKMFIKTEQRYNGGWAVYSCEEIEEGEVIDEITGELDFTSPETVFDQKCFVLPRTSVLIDFRKSGRISRLFKNSCFPNVVIREFIYNGEIRLLALARFKIMKGEELTIDYNVEYPYNE